jgi:hypothetical protein
MLLLLDISLTLCANHFRGEIAHDCNISNIFASSTHILRRYRQTDIYKSIEQA